MRECPQCFVDIYDDSCSDCPSCGVLLPTEGARSDSPELSPDELDLAPSVEMVHFRKQFEEKAIHLPAKVLERAKRILSSAETEIRRVTVLLVDLCGFSKKGRESSAEELSHFAEEFYKICTDCITRRGGFVVKFIGDAVLATFGSPVAFDRDTESAISAALDICEICEQSQAGEQPISVSIGIATGSLKSGLIDGPTGKSYDVVGDVVNLASRLQGVAGQSQILICEETHKTIDRYFETEPTPPLELKNISDDYVAHRVLRKRREKIVRRQFDTPFCGREKELTRLIGFLGRPATEGLQIAHVIGEAGLGKTRLIDEALKRVGLKDGSIWWENSPSGMSILFHPVIDWLSHEIGIFSDDSADHVSQSIRRYLSKQADDEEFNPLLLEYMFGVPNAIQVLQGIPPERVQKNLFALIRQLLMASSDGSSRVTLIIDDFQWADPLTTEFIKVLSQWPEPLILNIVLVYRSGAPSSAPPTPDLLTIRLKPLDEDERQSLLNKMVPTKDFLPEIRRFVLSKGSGNPLFLEEITRLVAKEMANNSNLNGDALLNHIIDVIPLSLHDLIQSRIDQLDKKTRQVLQCGSLLGMEFTFSLMEMFDTVQEGLLGHLHALRALRFINELPKPNDYLYIFTHGLFRDVAYSTLLEEQKENLHSRLAWRLEEAFADRIQEYYELLAFHFTRGKESRKALYYLVKAADRQSSLGCSSSAIDNYSEAIEMLRSLEPTPGRQILLARILIRCGRLNRNIANNDESDEMLSAAVECAQSLGNERLMLEAKLEQGISKIWRGELDSAGKLIEGLLQQASKLNCVAIEMIALNSLGVAYLQKGEFEEALSRFKSLATLAEKNKVNQVQADAFNNAGLIYWRWGQYSHALKAYKRAVALRREVSDVFGLCATLMNIGIIQEQMGKIGAAKKSYTNAMNLATKTGFTQALAALESNLANLERRVGTFAASMEHAARAVKHSRMCKDQNLESIGEENLGLALAAMGNNETALEHFARALECASSQGNAEQEMAVELSILDLTSRTGTPDKTHLEEINSLLEQLEARKYQDIKPKAYRIKARIVDALDNTNVAAAREYLQMACKWSGEMGNFFEELESWEEFERFSIQKGDQEQVKSCSERIAKMKQIF